MNNSCHLQAAIEHMNAPKPTFNKKYSLPIRKLAFYIIIIVTD